MVVIILSKILNIILKIIVLSVNWIDGLISVFKILDIGLLLSWKEIFKLFFIKFVI